MTRKALTTTLFSILFAAWIFAKRFMSEDTELVVMFGFVSVFVLVLIVWGFVRTGRDARSTRAEDDSGETGSDRSAGLK